MQRSKLYEARFQKEVLEEATQQLWSGLSKEALKEEVEGLLSVHVDDVEWTHDSEAEFFSDCRKAAGNAAYVRRRTGRELRVHVRYDSCDVIVLAPTRE